MPTGRRKYIEYGYVYIPLDKPKKKSKLRYYLFCIRWLWKNREWENTRQKFKAMEKAYKEMVGEAEEGAEEVGT